MLNLISNALKFTEKGRVSITITVLDPKNISYEQGDAITLSIKIADTGIGITKEKFDTIFEHFSRLTASYQGHYKGSGLGLYTVKRYMELMEGTISLDSEVGKGSCFTLTLPFTVDDHSDTEPLSLKKASLL